MKRASESCDLVIAGNARIHMTQFRDGSMMLEKHESGRWFVSTESDGNFYLQENLPDGEIRDLGWKDNLPEALYAIAWAN